MMKIQQTAKVHSPPKDRHRQNRFRPCVTPFAILPLAVAIGQALANPDGGVVVGGQASISQNPGVTTVDQASQRAIINWRGFSIDPGELTRFNQPGKNAVALNRVLGKDPSKLLGQLKANGHVWLVNPNGILFGPSARIDVHGLLATTADIADQDFLAGRNHFSIPSPNADASVLNQGSISIGEHGLAGLVAPHVHNAGVIQGQLGRVLIAGAPTFTLDFYGDGLIQFEATSKVTANADPAAPLVGNDGSISVDGGEVLITANAAAGVVDEAINMEGIVEARSVGMEDGAIVLDGGDAGIVRVAGSLDASGRGPGESGGTVKVLGEKIGLYAGTDIDAAGDFGGGEVLIGGNFRGQGPEPNAQRTYVATGTTLNADAVSEGDGGKVIVWADQVTGFNGHISAGGGSDGGDGGLVEVSGKQTLNFRGTVDIGTSKGQPGTLLLDPENIVIIDGSEGGGPDDNELADNEILLDDSPGATFTISETALEALPVEANVILEAANDITLENLDDNALTFAAGPGGSISFTADADGQNGGSFTMNSGDTILASGRDVTISPGTPVPGSDAGTVEATIGAIDTSDPSGGGDITIGPFFQNITLGALDSTSASGNGGQIVLNSLGNVIVTNGIDASGSPDGGDILIVGEEIDLLGTVGSVQSSNADLNIRPFALPTDTVIGGTDNATAALDLTSIELGALGETFDHVTIGSSDSGGSDGLITVIGVTLNNPLTLEASIITIDGAMTADSLALVADAIDVNANLSASTADGAIDINCIDGLTIGDFIDFETLGGPVTVDVSTAVSNLGALEIRSNGGDINFITGTGDIADGLSLFTDSSSDTAAGGSITVEAQGDVFLDGRPLNVDASGPLGGGTVTITSIGGNVDIGNLDASSGSASGGDVTIDALGDIFTGDINSSGSSGGGDITLTSTTGSIATDFATEGPPFNPIDSSSSSGIGGSVELSAPISIAVGGIDTGGSTVSGSIFLESDSLILTGGADSVLGGGATLSIQPASQDRNITVAGFADNNLNLTESDLDALADGFGAITIGRSDGSGTLTVQPVEDPGGTVFTAPLLLQSPGSGGAIVVDGPLQTTGQRLALIAGGVADINANLTTAGGAIDVTSGGAIDTSAGTIDSSVTSGDAGAISLSAATTLDAGDMVSTSDQGQGGAINLASAGELVAGSLTFGSLSGSGGGALTANTSGIITIAGLAPNGADTVIGELNAPSNIQLPGTVTTDSGSLTLFVTGGYTFASDLTTDQGDFTLNGLQAVTLSAPIQTSSGDVTVQTGGVLTLQAPLVSSDAQASIRLVTDSGFNNPLGESGLQPGDGRYLVYSPDPAADTRGIPPDQFDKRYSIAFDPADPDGSAAGLPSEGNFFLYEITPTLTIVADDNSRDFGEPNPAFSFTSSGLIDGDTLETALSEAPLLSTTAGVRSPPDNYPINVGPSDLSSPIGYAVVSTSGILSVLPTESFFKEADSNFLLPDIPVDERVEPEIPLVLTESPQPAFAVPEVGSRRDSGALLSPNDGNRELWGPQR